MKAKKKPKPSGPPTRKLIDRLVSNDGPLIALLGTTFEFDAGFLETDYLPSLLGLGAWDDRNWTSRIEIEKHLASTEVAAVFLDQACYRTRPRSLRLGVHPVTVGHHRILHAKVTLLVYPEAVRLIVGSANLTEFGYRKNREIAATLRATSADRAHGPLIRQAIAGLQHHLAEHWNKSAETATNLGLARLDAWGPPEPNDDATWFAWSGAGEPLWEQVVSRWPADERIHTITIVSPFWSEENGHGPIAQLVGGLRARDQLVPGARIRILADARPIANDQYLPILPATYATWDAGTLDVVATAAAVDPSVLPEEVDGMEEFRGTRKLHAKVVIFEGSTTTVAYLGSANFTQHGWGFSLGLPANLEAGLIMRAVGKDRARLTALVPAIAGPEVALDGAAGEGLALLGSMEAAAPWPTFIRALTLVPSDLTNDDLRLALEVVTVADEVQGEWSSWLPSDESRALVIGGPGQEETSRVELDAEQLARILSEQELLVKWWAHGDGTRIPINVSLEARLALPIAPGSARPGEQLLLSYYQGRIAWSALYPEPSDGPRAARRAAGLAQPGRYLEDPGLPGARVRRGAARHPRRSERRVELTGDDAPCVTGPSQPGRARTPCRRRGTALDANPHRRSVPARGDPRAA